MSVETKPKIAISSCLVGQEVRFDGGHKQFRYATESLATYFDFVPLCPEVAIGLGVPRPTIRLIKGENGTTEAVSNADRTLGYTEALSAYGRKTAPVLHEVSGYILKKGSPRCGMQRVKVYQNNDGPPDRTGAGIYAIEILNAHPNLPAEEEGPGLAGSGCSWRLSRSVAAGHESHYLHDLRQDRVRPIPHHRGGVAESESPRRGRQVRRPQRPTR